MRRWMTGLLLLGWMGVALAQAPTVRLGWDYTQGSDPATKFRVYRQTACTGGWTTLTPDVQPVGSSPATYTYQDTTAVVGQTYCWKVTAFTASGKESGPSNTATFQVPGMVANPVNLRVILE